jgi:hypothetical protein
VNEWTGTSPVLHPDFHPSLSKHSVEAGLVPAMNVLSKAKDVNARHKAGYDGKSKHENRLDRVVRGMASRPPAQERQRSNFIPGR